MCCIDKLTRLELQEQGLKWCHFLYIKQIYSLSIELSGACCSSRVRIQKAKNLATHLGSFYTASSWRCCMFDYNTSANIQRWWWVCIGESHLVKSKSQTTKIVASYRQHWLPSLCSAAFLFPLSPAQHLILPHWMDMIWSLQGTSLKPERSSLKSYWFCWYNQCW